MGAAGTAPGRAILYRKMPAVLCYIIRGGELFVDRRSKSITISTVAAALQKIATRQAAGEAITGPKKIGCYGASY